MRRAAKVDTTQRAIVQALRGVGARVWITHGAIDLIVSYHGHVYLMDAKATATAERTTTQRAMLADGWPVTFPASAQDALRLIGAME